MSQLAKRIVDEATSEKPITSQPPQKNQPAMPKKDFTQIAFRIAQIATGEAESEPELEGKKADSRKGGLKGGKGASR